VGVDDNIIASAFVGFSNIKKTPSGIEHATFQLVAQCIN
jgi:hypothetical protein